MRYHSPSFTSEASAESTIIQKRTGLTDILLEARIQNCPLEESSRIDGSSVNQVISGNTRNIRRVGVVARSVNLVVNIKVGWGVSGRT